MQPDLDSYWAQLSEDILRTEYSARGVTDLARAWGMKSSLPDSLRIEDVLSYSSLSTFQASTPGIGKTKIEIITSVLWRLWSEIYPGGPAGPPPSTPSIQARNILCNLGHSANPDIVIVVAMNLANLSQQAVTILQERYGLNGGDAKTLEAIGEQRGVTRERIRQIEERALDAIKRNLVANELLELTLADSTSAILENLVRVNGSGLLAADYSPRNWLRPGFSFLIDTLVGSLDAFLQQLETRKMVTRTSYGWWLGQDLGPDYEADYQRVGTYLVKQARPLAVTWLASELQITPATRLFEILEAHAIPTLAGMAFLGRPSAAEKRCLLALKASKQKGKNIWLQTELYQHAKELDSVRAASYRLFCRDLDAIPGLTCDSPGPFVAINPLAMNMLFDKSSPDTEWTEQEFGSAKEEDTIEPEREEESDALTLVDKIRSLFEGKRLVKFERLEEAFSRSNFGNPVISLGPILITSDAFVRYAPGYYGLTGLVLTDDDCSLLCNEGDVTKYVLSKRGGGIQSLFPFWTPQLEFAMARWGEHFAPRPLFESLLTVIEPSSWPVPVALQRQWVDKQKKWGLYRLPSPVSDFSKGITDFSIFYGLTMLALERGDLGYAAISQFCGWGFKGDRRSLTTIAVLVALGVLKAREEIDLPHMIGSRAREVLDQMSNELLKDPSEVQRSWTTNLSEALLIKPHDEQLGWFETKTLREARSSWTLSNSK
jgi:hypothetical protein